MTSTDSSRFVHPARLALAVAGLIFLLACKTQAAAPASGAREAQKPAETSSPASAPAPSPSWQTRRKAAEPPPAEPPDGKWLTDEQGKQYFLQEVPKVEGWYHFLDPEKTQVRLAYGMTFDVAAHDEDSITLKIFKPAADTAPRPSDKPELTAAEKEKIAASYRNETGTADRVAFEPFGKGLPPQGQWRNGFKVADMNGDGHPDIVHGPARKATPRPNIFLGDGKGNWRRWSEARFPPLPYDYGDVAVADFNGDGRPDLAMAAHLRGLLVLVADGPASFKEWRQGIDFQVPGQGEDAASFSSRALEAADWNGDGRPDLIALGEGPRLAVGSSPGQPRGSGASSSYGVVVYLNQGDGTWTRQDELKDGTKLFGEDLAVADFTSDGHLDILLATSVLAHENLLRIGEDDGGWTKPVLSGLRPRAFVGAVDAADFNADGRIDLVLGYLSREADIWRTGIDVLLNRAGGVWERRAVAVKEGRDWLTALDSGDVDGDGKLDLAATTGIGEIWVFVGNGDGSFAREESPEMPPVAGQCRGYDVHLVNLDADPGEELVAEFAGEPSALFAPDQCPSGGSLQAWKPKSRK